MQPTSDRRDISYFCRSSSSKLCSSNIHNFSSLTNFATQVGIDESEDFGKELLDLIEDPHIFANLLKKYLRELPDPLLGDEFYDDWISIIYRSKEALLGEKDPSKFQQKACCTELKTSIDGFSGGELGLRDENDSTGGETNIVLLWSKKTAPVEEVKSDNPFCSPEEAVTAIRTQISRLPQFHQDLLEAIVKMMRLISQYSSDNKMDSQNLATVIGPNILWKKELAIVADISTINDLIIIFIQNYDAIFGSTKVIILLIRI